MDVFAAREVFGEEVCRFMSSPTETSEAALKRMGRYLLRRMRCVYSFPFQRAEGIEVYGDTDWAGCPRAPINQWRLCDDWQSSYTDVELDPGVGDVVIR